MPSDGSFAWLTDIKQNIELARSFIAGMSFDSFRADRRTVYAATRCLEIISEASRRLPEEVKTRHPHIRWRGAAGAGNVYRHDYEDVADEALWHTTHHSLPPLLAVVEQELSKLEKFPR
jgi:uncharacterized protein with HEPN domain